MVNSFVKSGTRLAAMTGFVVATGVVGAAPALAADAQLVVSPTTDITDGQSLAVTGTGFSAGATVFVAECADNAAAHSCDLASGDLQVVVADGNGAISASLPARRTFAGADPATGAPTGTVDCTIAPGCAIAASVDRSTPAAPPVVISFARGE
ncbi:MULTISPECIES: enediyne antibiotic chromoprotein [Amycolatopsis]|uniref:Neocarzinostatin family protein n=1 Tax=Amycolatopsis dendrobii TaxID=2760662 RepID=A0A7W3W0P2_9PSEU|nr:MULTISPECIES: enediyne antibiotic chromoprotein [Amycolatopsis]MBB1156137.1 hypothetical protein [Amycolatopsis dendrobii]UKD58664.1 hypothetical protein L3Q65_18685 [Amycolatopsis sp. FU40]